MEAPVKRPSEVRAEQRAKRAREALMKSRSAPAAARPTATATAAAPAMLTSSTGSDRQAVIQSNISKLDDEEDDDDLLVAANNARRSRAGGGAGKATPSMRYHTVAEADFPPDWSLKTRATFQASFDLEWVRTVGGAAPFSDIVSSFQLPDSDVSDAAARAWAKSLVYYVHPAHDRLSEQSSASDKRRKQAEAVYQWCDAFRSLYYSYRYGKCPHFYIKLPSFTILWRATAAEARSSNEVDGDPNPAEMFQCVAFVSRSTSAFRQKLRRFDVDFTMPVDIRNKIAEADKREESNDRELLELERTTSRASLRTKANDSSIESLLRIEGHEAIGGLFEVVLEQVESAMSSGWGATFRLQGGPPASQVFNRSSSPGDDAPALLSPVPFLYGTLRSVQPSFCGSVQNNHQEEQRLEYKMVGPGGFLMPETLKGMRRALALVAEDCGGTFEGSFEADKDSSRLCFGGAAEVVNFKYEGSRFEVSSRVRDEAGAARLQLGAAGAAKQEGEGGGRGMGRGQGSKSGGA